MTLFILWISRDSKPHRLITSKFNACILALISGFAVFAYKGLYIAVKRGDIDLIISNVVNPKYYLSTIESSEPFITQAILNEVLRQSFVIGIDHLKSLFYQLVLFAPDLGYNIVSFNDIFQPALFPESGWMGMANNIWGEAISSGGWPLLIMFAIIYSLLLGVGSYLLRSHDPEIKAGMALIFSWWAFYINRNDLFNQISFEKRIVLLWMGCVVGSMFINLLAERLKKTISVSGPV